MRAVFHAVPVERVLDRLDHARAVEADIEIDHARAFEQPVHVRIEADQPALHETQSLPHAVTQREA